MKNLLVITQLSNYDKNGKFILEADSGFQMCMGRIRQMLDYDPDLCVSITVPYYERLLTKPESIYNLSKYHPRLKFLELDIVPNAIVTRYDFDWDSISYDLQLDLIKNGKLPKYDVVYLNDPMHLRALKAMFFIQAGYEPKFAVHSHFIDNPECPKFPKQTSLWLGQCEAAIKADYNFWQCGSSMDVFFDSMSKIYKDDVVNDVRAKSMPWDDGYSGSEISSQINHSNVRFSRNDIEQLTKDKIVIFVPNRIGGRGRSSDYTNCGKFMFEILPKLRAIRDDFVVFAGNPSQKFSNEELEKECGPNGYINIVPGTLRRDEYKFLASFCDIAVGLYDQDSYGGTAARELVDMGVAPFWIDKYEYKAIAELANWKYLAPCGFGDDFVSSLDSFMTTVKNKEHLSSFARLREVVQDRCSYEQTTSIALQIMRSL